MELILLLVGIAVVLISAILVFFITSKAMKESSYEEVAAAKSKRDRAIEEELGITGKDAKKDKKKPKKEKKGKDVVKGSDETEATAGSSDDSEELEPSKLDVVESKKLVKGKKQKSTDAGKIPDAKKPGKTSAAGGEKTETKSTGGGAQSSKAQSGKAKKEQDEFQAPPEPDAPFIVAESKHRKKKAAAAAEASGATKTVARETTATVVTPKVATPARVEVKSPAKEVTSARVATPAKVEVKSPAREVISPKVATPAKVEAKNPASNPTANAARVSESATSLDSRRQAEELVTLRQSFAALESRSRNELAEKVKEIDALKIRLNHSHMEHVAQMNQLTQQLGKPKGQAVAAAGDGQTQLIKILSDENRKLKEEAAAAKNRPVAPPPSAGPAGSAADLQQKVQFMDDALKQNAMLLNSSENARKTAELKLKQAEKKIEVQLKDFEKAKETGELLKKSETKSKALSDELEAAKKEAASFQEQLSKSKSEGQRTLELEEKTKSLESQFKVLEQLIKQKDVELETSKSTASQLTEDLKRTDEAKSKALVDLEEEKKRNNESSKEVEEVQRLQDELKTSESSKANLESQIAEAGKLQNKLQTELSHYQAILADTEKSLTAIQSSIESEEKKWHQKLATVEDQLKVSRDEVVKLTDELGKLKNNPENVENGTLAAGDDLQKGESNRNHVEDSSDKTVTS